MRFGGTDKTRTHQKVNFEDEEEDHTELLLRTERHFYETLCCKLRKQGAELISECFSHACSF